MTVTTVSPQVTGPSGAQTVDTAITELLLAGYTGRDRAKVLAHVRELELAGVAPPDRAPSLFVLEPGLLTTGDAITVQGPETSGEVEMVLVRSSPGIRVTVGSDHTDRQIERESVARSKTVCAKVVASGAWRVEEVAGRWDTLELRSWSTFDGRRKLYREGSLADFLTVDELCKELAAMGRPPTPGQVIFGGTLALSGHGTFEYGERFETEVRDPATGRTLGCSYAVRTPMWSPQTRR